VSGAWLEVVRGDAPLIVSIPHSGTMLAEPFGSDLVSEDRARKDADWHVERLYDFAPELGATTIRTAISRTVIDVNRDPSGATLYPGQQTTELCPTTTFDGEPLYREGAGLQREEIPGRRARYFEPYHAALQTEIERVHDKHRTIVLCDCHSIRSVVPRLFDGELPHFNIGTNKGASCDPTLTTAVEAVCAATKFSRITNGRFTGGWITRRYGRPQDGVHAVQMELSCRGYMLENPGPVVEGQWPTPYDPAYAKPMRDALTGILQSCLNFARQSA